MAHDIGEYRILYNLGGGLVSAASGWVELRE